MEYTPSNQTYGYCEEIETHVRNLLERNNKLSIDQAIKIIEIGIKAQELDIKEKYYEMIEKAIETIPGVSEISDALDNIIDMYEKNKENKNEEE